MKEIEAISTPLYKISIAQTSCLITLVLLKITDKHALTEEPCGALRYS